MVASPKHPVLNTPAQMRRASTLLLPAVSGAPLIKSTRDLAVTAVWMDGTASCDVDMIKTPARVQKYLPGFLRKSFQTLVQWKESQGYVLAPYNPGQQPPRHAKRYNWVAMEGGRYWACGPFEALVIGGIKAREVDPRTGRSFDVEIARKHTVGDERLQETGGKVAYRVASFFTVRQHLAELPVRRDRHGKQPLNSLRRS
jgi:hypothetical protein